MSIAVDAATSATSTTSASTLTYSHTCSGSNRALFVQAGVEWFGVSPSSVTYAAVALTQLWAKQTVSSFYNQAAYYMVAPATGANNVVVTMSGAADRMTSGALSMTGVDQVTPVGTPTTTTGSATDPTVTIASAATDLMVCAMTVNYNDQMVNDSGQTEQTRSGPAGEISCIATKPGTGSNVTFVWNHGSGSSNFCIGAVAFKQVSVAPASIYSTDVAATRNRPGRGPYSLGAYFRPSIDAFGTGRIVQVPPASITLNAFAPVVAATANNIIAVPLATITLAAQTPTVVATANNVISVPAASITLDGKVPTVSATGNNLIAVPAASITLAVLAPTVQNGANLVIDVPKGTISLTANAPTVVQTANQVIAIPLATVSLGANAPVVVATANNLIAVPLATLSLQGLAPTVVNSGTIQPPRQRFVAAGDQSFVASPYIRYSVQ